MKSLTVLFDQRCELCRSARQWLARQPAFVPLEFLPAASQAARERFPELDAQATLADLTLVSDEGDVYRGARAWLMCLWALTEYRAWALRLSTPELMPLAERAIKRLSDGRQKLGSLAWLLRVG